MLAGYTNGPDGKHRTKDFDPFSERTEDTSQISVATWRSKGANALKYNRYVTDKCHSNSRIQSNQTNSQLSKGYVLPLTNHMLTVPNNPYPHYLDRSSVRGDFLSNIPNFKGRSIRITGNEHLKGIPLEAVNDIQTRLFSRRFENFALLFVGGLFMNTFGVYYFVPFNLGPCCGEY